MASLGQGVCEWKNSVALYFFHMVYIAKKILCINIFP